jgi:hypothetical protein
MNMIKLKDLICESIREGGKLFGSRASRVTTPELNVIFNEIKQRLGSRFSKFNLSKALPSKLDHGDIDIVVSGNPDIKKQLFTYLGPMIKDYSKNGNIHSILFQSSMGKTVHVDFIYATEDEYDAQFDYLSYNDFSGIIGVMARQLGFKYGTDGFFKIYEDKKGRNHYIPITKNLRDGLRMMGYDAILSKFDDIKTIDDIASFISHSDLFDSKYFKGDDLNRSDRRRLRSDRPSAQEIRNKLLSINKPRTQLDDDFYIKKLFPNKYKELVDKEKEIESFAPANSKYGGDWIMSNFPQVKPGPIFGKIKLHWTGLYGDKIDEVPEDELKKVTANFIQSVVK